MPDRTLAPSAPAPDTPTPGTPAPVVPAPPVRRLRVTHRTVQTADAVTLTLAPADPDAAPLTWRPGQFLTLRTPGGARCYSLATSPHTGEAPAVTVKRVPGGAGSGWLHDTVAVGDHLDALPPAGTFTPSDLHTDLLLVAGGSGITPVLSIAASVLAAGTARVTVLYFNRAADTVIHHAELLALSTAHPDRCTVVHWLEDLQGLPEPARLAPLCAPYAGRPAYLCGPAPLMDAAEQALRAVGTPGRAVHRERYFSLSEDVFTPRPPADTDPADSAVDGAAEPPAVAEITLDGAHHTVPWPRATPLLDALLAAGVDAPHSCREGACGACCLRVLDGDTELIRNEVLDADDLAEGYTLACQALPRTDRVRLDLG
ncbi:2Fe-2S iron-sulfur cluster-binding protein [Streptomyces sp. BI20]|uniref:2Fe-2S iron-sulfur cluster-binding protein n=1 Tax=Streptomyces sp. BI20 TaxID=3403460 RepID=UPI003C796813